MKDPRRDLELAIVGWRDAVSIHNLDLAERWAELAFRMWDEANWADVERKFSGRRTSDPDDDAQRAKEPVPGDGDEREGSGP